MFKSLWRLIPPYLPNQLSWNYYPYLLKCWNNEIMKFRSIYSLITHKLIVDIFDSDMSTCPEQLFYKYITEEKGSSHLNNRSFNLHWVLLLNCTKHIKKLKKWSLRFKYIKKIKNQIFNYCIIEEKREWACLVHRFIYNWTSQHTFNSII